MLVNALSGTKLVNALLSINGGLGSFFLQVLRHPLNTKLMIIPTIMVFASRFTSILYNVICIFSFAFDV